MFVGLSKKFVVVWADLFVCDFFVWRNRIDFIFFYTSLIVLFGFLVWWFFCVGFTVVFVACWNPIFIELVF